MHRHTVDRHLVETVVAASGFVRDVARPDLLVLAALLHDIGKVGGAMDHSRTGAGLADRILRRMGASDPDREVIVRLVREHLTLVELATRRDPEDAATITALSEAGGCSVMILELVRALTEAGIPFYQSGVQRFQIAAFESQRHLIYVISDLPQAQNMQTMTAMGPELKDYLDKLTL